MTCSLQSGLSYDEAAPVADGSGLVYNSLATENPFYLNNVKINLYRHCINEKDSKIIIYILDPC